MNALLGDQHEIRRLLQLDCQTLAQRIVEHRIAGGVREIGNEYRTLLALRGRTAPTLQDDHTHSQQSNKCGDWNRVFPPGPWPCAGREGLHRLIGLIFGVLDQHLRTRAAGDQRVFTVKTYSAYFCGETVTAPGKRCDVLPVFWRFSKYLAEHEYGLAEVGILNEGIGPKLRHEVILGYDLAAMADQNQKCLEDLAANGNRL